MQFRAVVSVRNKLLTVEVPKVLMENRRYAKVEGTLNGRTFVGYAGSTGQGAPSLILSPSLAADLGLSEGAEVTVDIKVVSRELPGQRVHPLLEEALKERSASLAVLSTFERRQLLTAVNEASSANILKKRIEAVVSACVKHIDPEARDRSRPAAVKSAWERVNARESQCRKGAHGNYFLGSPERIERSIMEYPAVSTEVKKLLVSSVGLSVDPYKIEDDEPIWEGRFNISSLAAIELLSALEQRFGIEFPDEMVDFRLFASIRRLATAVCDLMANAPLSPHGDDAGR
jgi:acyl carrier protein